MKQPITIGNLAKQSGVGVQTVRFYERKGLLPKPARRASGYREYEPEDAVRIRFIKRAQDLGFTLKEIHELLKLNGSSGKRGSMASCSDVKKKADDKLAEVEAKIKDLQRMKKTLRELSDACAEGDKAVSQCDVLGCFETGWRCQ